MRRHALALAGAIALITAARLLFCSRLGLIPDETYYWTWGKRLALCYFDQPGMTAWVNALSARLLGTSPLAVRAPALLLGVCGTILVYLTARTLFADKTKALLSAIAFNLVPLFAAGTVLMIHDTVLSLFWLLALYAMARLLKKPGALNYTLLALALLGALYSKLTATLLCAMVALCVLAIPRLRASLRTPWPWLAATIVAIGFAPVIVWNVEHQWITVLVVDKIGHRAHADLGQALQYFVETLLAQLVLVPPAILGAVVAVRAMQDYRRRPQSPELLLALLSVPMLIYFLLIAFRTEVQANWPALAHAPLVLLAVSWTVDAWRGGRRAIARLGVALLVIAAVLTVVMHVQALRPILPVARIISAIGMPQRARDLTDQAYGWPELAQRVQREIQDAPDPAHTIAGSRCYQIASELEYHLPGSPQTFSANYSTKGNDYDLRVDYHALEGWTFVIVDLPGMKLTSRFRKHFGGCELLRGYVERCGGCDVRQWFGTLGLGAQQTLGRHARPLLSALRPLLSCCRRLPDFEFSRDGRTFGRSEVWRCEGFGVAGSFEDYFDDPLGNVAQRLRDKRENR
ncbi:MAG: glycosyltransferase family 39 protein [Candidatus Alcyoniella australis]|nr:glycosyltransferase family 39 protein [Candidatus Alcyoniella australis]